MKSINKILSTKTMLSKAKALKKAMYICSQKEQCKYDIIQKFRKWELEEKYNEELIAKLVQEKFIDEERYTQFYVKDKFQLNKWGKTKIRYMLRQKRIAENTIEGKLSTINDEEYNETCKNLITQKVATLKKISPLKLKKKVFRYLSSRGFEPDIIIKQYNKTITHA